MRTPAEIFAEHNAPLVEGVSAPPATAADACQCTDCRTHVAVPTIEQVVAAGYSPEAAAKIVEREQAAALPIFVLAHGVAPAAAPAATVEPVGDPA